MAENFTINVRGLKESQKALYTFSQRLGDRVVLGAIRRGANLVLKDARAKAPYKTGRLRRSIILKASRIHNGRGSNSLIGLYITIRGGKDGAYYGRFQEDGWNTRGKRNASRFSKMIKGFTRRTVGRSSRKTRPGKTDVPGKKFIDQAWLDNRERAVALIVQAANAGAGVLANKLGLISDGR